MDRSVAEYLHEACSNNGLETQIIEYSGRFMFGRETWALVIPGSVIEVVEALLNMEEPFDNQNGFESLRQDQFGLGMVIY